MPRSGGSVGQLLQSRLRVSCLFGLFALATAALNGAVLPAHASECLLEDDGKVARVTEIVDGDTLLLDDGREVRLTGIQAPKLPLGRPDVEAWPLAQEARAALAQLAAGKQARLRYGGERSDRHGRTLAQVFVEQPEGESLWLQQQMLSRGLARVYTFDDNRACSEELFAEEREARAAKLGIWNDPFYEVRNPSDVGILEERLGRFELVQGRIVAAAIVRDRLYLNFGEDYRQDFTVTVQGRGVKLFKAEEPWASLLGGETDDASALAGRLVRVRGWLDRYNGPEIEVTHPEQIELLRDGK